MWRVVCLCPTEHGASATAVEIASESNCEGTGQKSEKAICEMNESEIGFWS